MDLDPNMLRNEASNEKKRHYEENKAKTHRKYSPEKFVGFAKGSNVGKLDNEKSKRKHRKNPSCDTAVTNKCQYVEKKVPIETKEHRQSKLTSKMNYETDMRDSKKTTKIEYDYLLSREIMKEQDNLDDVNNSLIQNKKILKLLEENNHLKGIITKKSEDTYFKTKISRKSPSKVFNEDIQKTARKGVTSTADIK